MDSDDAPIDRFPKREAELKEALRGLWHRHSVTGSSSPGEDLVDLVPWRLPKSKKLPKKLRLWLMIYDESVAWICALHACCEFSLYRKPPFKRRELVIAVYRLSARIVSDLYAVRNLVCFGLEPAARVVLRSAMEHVDTASLLVLEPERAPDFLSTSEPQAGNAFWHRNLSKEKLRNRIRGYFKDLDEDVGIELLSQRERRSALYGIAVHPSAYSCDMSLFSPEAMKRDAGHIGIGYPTNISCNTLHDAIWSLLEFSLVLKRQVLDKAVAQKAFLGKDVQPYLRQIVREGPSVLFAILRTINHPSMQTVYHDLIDPTYLNTSER